SSSARTATRIVATTLLETFLTGFVLKILKSVAPSHPRHRALSGRQKPRNPAVFRFLLNHPVDAKSEVIIGISVILPSLCCSGGQASALVARVFP
ncbi:MAG: hypothetical protein ACXW3X_05930, partial [Rhodoplanes sp.]